MSTVNQAYVFLTTVYTGIIIGFIYDLNRVIRRVFKPGVWIVGIMDLLFWLVVSVIAFLVLLYANDGEIRLYNFIGLAMGWSLYVLTISSWVIKVLSLICRGMAKVLVQ
jgi:spore cortex biosynthesis protein YabQ